MHICNFISEGCAAEEPLLNGANPVPDSYFTASSEYSASYAAHLARLNGLTSFWSPLGAERDAIPPAMFLQVSQCKKEFNNNIVFFLNIIRSIRFHKL